MQPIHLPRPPTNQCNLHPTLPDRVHGARSPPTYALPARTLLLDGWVVRPWTQPLARGSAESWQRALVAIDQRRTCGRERSLGSAGRPPRHGAVRLKVAAPPPLGRSSRKSVLDEGLVNWVTTLDVVKTVGRFPIHTWWY